MAEIVRRSVEARKRKDDEDAVEEGERGCAETFAVAQEEGSSTDYEPDRGDISKEVCAGDVISPCLQGLMRGLELAPNEIENSGGDCGDAEDGLADSHERSFLALQSCDAELIADALSHYVLEL